MKKLLIVAVAALALLVPMSASAAPRHHTTHAPSVQYQNYVLRLQVHRLAVANQSLRINLNTARINTLNARLERDTALQGLPNAIRVVPAKDFHRLVFAPAFSVYPCDTYFDSTVQWTFTFSKTC